MVVTEPLFVCSAVTTSYFLNFNHFQSFFSSQQFAEIQREPSCLGTISYAEAYRNDPNQRVVECHCTRSERAPFLTLLGDGLIFFLFKTIPMCAVTTNWLEQTDQDVKILLSLLCPHQHLQTASLIH